MELQSPCYNRDKNNIFLENYLSKELAPGFRRQSKHDVHLQPHLKLRLFSWLLISSCNPHSIRQNTSGLNPRLKFVSHRRFCKKKKMLRTRDVSTAQCAIRRSTTGRQPIFDAININQH